MRILYFTRDYTTHDHRFLSALAETEHRVYYLRLERRGHQLEDRSLPPQIEQVAWRGGRSPARLKDGPALLLDLKRVIREIKPDLIQAGPLQRSALLVALAGFRPLVSMSWGYDLLQDAGRNALWRWATRLTLKRSAAMIGDCNTIRQLAIEYGMQAERIVTYPWGVDLKHFSPAPEEDPCRQGTNEATPNPKDPQRPFTLLSTRSWEPIYGVETISRAFAKAARQRPELRLVMLGNGSQASLLRRALASGEVIDADVLHSRPGESYRVIFPGQVSYTDLPRYYRSADLYLAATLSDGASISLLEAMACGCPALVSDIPGNREWITPGENGWLSPVGDAEALAQAILHAVDQRQRLPEMGHAARRLAEQRADWSKNFPKLLAAYEIALH
ncbi:MAG: glycosyltransferase [Anaerolineales bacterium]|nr:glycosyltransferase [Anaerolineales bacterium]